MDVGRDFQLESLAGIDQNRWKDTNFHSHCLFRSLAKQDKIFWITELEKTKHHNTINC